MKIDANKLELCFAEKNGDFTLQNADFINYLYFPLANESGLMSVITPTLNGDIKSNQNQFLTMPVSVEDLHNTKSSRNFWIYSNEIGAWSATGNSSRQISNKFEQDAEETVTVEAGLLWHRICRKNTKIGIESKITSFVPMNEDKVELMMVEITNLRKDKITITPTAAIPIFGRSADNLRDHRHVTSLLNRIHTDLYGVTVKPTLSFDESGHKLNNVLYAVQGADESGVPPIGFFPIVEEFIGEGGSFECPEKIIKNSDDYCGAKHEFSGYEAIGGLRFNDVSLESGQSISYILSLSINDINVNSEFLAGQYCRKDIFENHLKYNKQYWQKKVENLKINSQSKEFDSWMKWVTIQPVLRRIYGCSFMPYHDYGRGGRGWRDLWQDCLALLVMEPEDVGSLLKNNYAGVRIDGTNATIIGSKPGEFVADRNNIARVWMDHGAWPFITTKLYIDYSGDIEFLLEEQSYFKDKQILRGNEKDETWSEENGNILRDYTGNEYMGSILEHILIQNLTPFFNVGEHNNILLEGADWNDAFDMAGELGESVAFTSFYANNLMQLSEMVLALKRKKSIEKVEILEEVRILLDSLDGDGIDYSSVEEKRKCLEAYYEVCRHNISGDKVLIDVKGLAEDLRKKADSIVKNVRKNEYIKNREGFEWFNGYYDNDGQRVEGDFESGTRMTLTGQVFAIMSGVATNNQVKRIVASANRYLKDASVGGYRLNSNFNEVKLNFGRCFGFAYGHKENGAVFSHMTIMYANALYRRGFAKEGYEVINTLCRHCMKFDLSKMYPGIPEYINPKGRGMYPYLTGSASWLLLTFLNEIYGVKGELGDLKIQPKLLNNQFNKSKETSITTLFAGKKIKVVFKNEELFSYGEYIIGKVALNGEIVKQFVNNEFILIERELINNLKSDKQNIIEVELVGK